MADEIGAGRRAVPGHHVDRAGEADLGGQLGQPQGRDPGVCGSGLRTTEHPAASAGASFHRHQQRVVPGHDLAGDADRLLQRVGEERAADRVEQPAIDPIAEGEEAEVLDGAEGSAFVEEIALPTLRDSSSVSSLRFAESASASACRRQALVCRGLPPVAVERGAGGLDRAVDLGLARELRGSEGLARAGSIRSRADEPSTTSPLMKSPNSFVATATAGRYRLRVRA